jgi:hypothetical protein
MSDSESHAMRCFIAGFLLSCVLPNRQDVFKIVHAGPGNESPTGFEMELASGLKLAVRVAVVSLPKTE